MKTPIDRTWETALGWQEYAEASRQFGADAPTLAGVVISGAPEQRVIPAALPPGCVFAVRYVSR